MYQRESFAQGLLLEQLSFALDFVKEMNRNQTILLFLLIVQSVVARGISSRIGASCLYVAANFTSFPFDCEMPDLAFKCRCQNEAFLGTVTNCIETHSNDPDELSRAYRQLVEICEAQGGKSWSFIDLVKINENATSFLMSYDEIPVPVYKASLVWKAKQIHEAQTKSNLISSENKSSGGDNGNTNYRPTKLAQVILESPVNGKEKKENRYKNADTGIIKNDSFVGSVKSPAFDSMKNLEKIGIDNIIETPRFLLYYPVAVPDNLYKISLKSVSNLMDQRRLATAYGYYVYFYWACVMFIAMLANLTQWTSPYYNNKLGRTKFALWLKSKIICCQIIEPSYVANLKSGSAEVNMKRELFGSPMGLFNSHDRIGAQNIHLSKISEASVGDNKVNQSIASSNVLYKGNKDSSKRNQKSKLSRDCKANFMDSVYMMPARLYGFIIIGYLVLNVVLCCINYEIVYPNTVFTCRKGQNFVLLADRTGIIATVQLPLVYLLSARNNLLSNITGLSYRSFQLFHKWVSRAVFLLLSCHCVFYLLFVNARGDYIERWGLLKWKCANTAFAVLAITTGLSFLRKCRYEFFKISHKLLLAIFSIGSWYHCLTLGWIEYLGVAYMFWAFEYIVRACKIFASGGILKGHCNLVYNTADSTPQSIRIVINHSGWWRPYPGCYCWFRVLKHDMFWESHPFTVVSATHARNYNQLVFVIRVKNGLTKRLAEYISTQPNSKCSINLLVEGPYGNSVPFKQYNQSLLVAGGVGLAVIYSLAKDIAQIYRAQELRGKSNPAPNRKMVFLLWIVPNFESVLAFRNEIEGLTSFHDTLVIQIFITKPLQDELLQSIVDAHNMGNPLSALRACSGGSRHAPVEKDSSSDTAEPDQESNRGVAATGPLSPLRTCCGPFDTEGIAADAVVEKAVSRFPEASDDPELNRRGDVVREQRLQQVEFLHWLISANGKQIEISFEDKPYLQAELDGFVSTHVWQDPMAVIACGPTNLNADVRLSVVKCLDKGCCVDYYEEELLW